MGFKKTAIASDSIYRKHVYRESSHITRFFIRSKTLEQYFRDGNRGNMITLVSDSDHIAGARTITPESCT